MARAEVAVALELHFVPVCTTNLEWDEANPGGLDMRLMTISLLLGAVAIGSDRVGAPAAVVFAASDPAPANRWVGNSVTLPAGTTLSIVLDTGVGSDISRIEQPVRGHLARAVMVHGVTVVPAGSAVSGIVTDARRSGRVKGRAHVALRFTSLTPTGDSARYDIRTAPIGRTAPATKEEDALKIGAPAAGGAIVGAIVGGKKGAAIGAAAGGGAGTAVVLSTRGKEVRLGRGARVNAQLEEPLRVRVRA
jgi:hypothetical protein